MRVCRQLWLLQKPRCSKLVVGSTTMTGHSRLAKASALDLHSLTLHQQLAFLLTRLVNESPGAKSGLLESSNRFLVCCTSRTVLASRMLYVPHCICVYLSLPYSLLSQNLSCCPSCPILLLTLSSYLTYCLPGNYSLSCCLF